MKNLSFSLFCSAIIWINCGCTRPISNNGQEKVIKIMIIDKTFLDYYMNNAKVRDTTILDRQVIGQCQSLVAGMKEVQGISGKKNVGYYEIKLFFSENNFRSLDLVYSVYDGVVIYDDKLGKQYRSEQLEQFISYIFRKQPFR